MASWSCRRLLGSALRMPGVLGIILFAVLLAVSVTAKLRRGSPVGCDATLAEVCEGFLRFSSNDGDQPVSAYADRE